MSIQKFQEIITKSPILGLLKDLDASLTPARGWQETDQFHFVNDSVEKLKGWNLFSSQQLDGKINYGFDFQKLDGSRYFIVGTQRSLYRYDSSLHQFIKLNTCDYPYAKDFRWQSAVLNDKLYLVNGAAPIQVFVDSSTPIADLVGDAAMPTTARYIINFVNHLLVGVPTEGGVTSLQRVRWSELDNPNVWQRTISNEADFIDMGEDGDTVQNMKLLGPDRAVVYKESGIYALTYVGLPFIMTVNRVVSDEGLKAPYSLVSERDAHYILGNKDFYQFTGSNIHNLGALKIRDFFKSDVMPTEESNTFGLAHPFFPEIWWVYKSKSALPKGCEESGSSSSSSSVNNSSSNSSSSNSSNSNSSSSNSSNNSESASSVSPCPFNSGNAPLVDPMGTLYAPAGAPFYLTVVVSGNPIEDNNRTWCLSYREEFSFPTVSNPQAVWYDDTFTVRYLYQDTVPAGMGDPDIGNGNEYLSIPSLTMNPLFLTPNVNFITSSSISQPFAIVEGGIAIVTGHT